MPAFTYVSFMKTKKQKKGILRTLCVVQLLIKLRAGKSHQKKLYFTLLTILSFSFSSTFIRIYHVTGLSKTYEIIDTENEFSFHTKCQIFMMKRENYQSILIDKLIDTLVLI